MKLQQLALSNHWHQRLVRHTLFWMAWLFFLSINNFLFVKNMQVPSSLFLTIALIRMFVLFCDIATCYFIVYVMLPRFNGKLLQLIGWLVIFSLVVFTAMNAVIFSYLGIYSQGREAIILEIINQLRNFLRAGPLVVCALLAACKMLKTYYLKTEERKLLVRENALAELQLLKAQVHPHFLFNTLNNIFSLIINRSKDAAMLVTRLSGTLHYMIFECCELLVPLEQELQMIRNYAGLEQVRYGERLSMQIEVEGVPGERLVAPLLLIPLLENSFKHGTSKMLEYPWINMKITIRESDLLFALSNSKPPVSKLATDKSGLGLMNVKKRLELLYPGQYDLSVNAGRQAFSVTMRIPLHREKLNAIHFEDHEQSYFAVNKTASYA